ncbi:site-specific DNA-methyltransferase [Hyphobacterium sp.]|uniref:site-specific DNA-methyltransferase n=1 Tax=Hyphobacterium sp. TaxID=2004662 RepID=UPI003BAB49CA
MAEKTKLELTWIGKNDRPKLEPRILIEDPEKSYHASERQSDSDIFDNVLIHGDNLLALKALEQEYAGKVKCIYIDPPFNTGQAFEHYDDGLESSIWLSLMRDRLLLLKSLLNDEGVIWVHLDDNEVHYLKVLMDEIFGRNCFVASVCWRSADSSNNDAKQFSIDHNTILVYSASEGWRSRELARTEAANAHYKNPDNDPRGPWFQGNLSSPNPRANLRYEITSPQGHIVEPPANGWRWGKERMTEMIESGEIVFVDDGKRIMRKTYLADQKGLSPSSLWHDIEDTGHNRQAKYELKKLFPGTPTSELFRTPKPERLIQKILNVSTDPGDLVLDSFAGSGTTGAVAHKMGRKWIMVELHDHCHTHIVPRMKKVIDSDDPGGITDAVNWKGGGGFRYFNLAPSLLEQDKYGNWVISKEYRPEMLAEAMCKHMGFTYAPSDNPEEYWKHGHSTETDFIYVTTQSLTHAALTKISDDVGPDRSLLICCKAFKAEADKFDNLTIVKIPQTILRKCEWGRDDYSLNVSNLPMAEPDDPDADLPLFSEPENAG